MNRKTGRNIGLLAGGVGCAIVIAIVACVGAILTIVFGSIRSSQIYEMTLTELRQNERAIAILGEPIEDGLIPGGEISTTNASGYADLSIPVSGPNASGRAYVRGTRSLGAWSIDELVLEVDGERVQLIPETGR